MAKIEFPNPLKKLLKDSDLQAPIRTLADRVGKILADNKLPFFPDYTDHGTDHINRVLKSEVDLIPKYVWKNSKADSDPRLLCDADAAVIIGATLLHDIAMHLWPDGFLKLVSKDSRFQPLPWFKEDHEGYSADRPWHELWEVYTREARRFSDRDLSNIIGEGSVTLGWKFEALPTDTGQWKRNHYLIIGEFIRRHHARLAHEIAIYGFPGLLIGSGEGQFPAMGEEVGHWRIRLADLIGITARSHGMSLRVCKSYLDSQYSGTPRPLGTAVLYPMALLRVADYLQIDQQRAPAILLNLRNPQSPISVQEWEKHRAVINILPSDNPRGKLVTVSTELSLNTYLQLRDLLNGLQAEMDQSTAVLDEVYGNRADIGLDKLNLETRRIDSNLQSPAYRNSLSFVPNRTGFAADPNLLTLLVEPLYGNQPGVGVRELMQNAVDAVCELEAWCESHGKTIESLDLPKQDGDVLIEFVKRDDETWVLRVQDRGIGMKSETIQDYFLRAGASFRHSVEWTKEFLDEKGQPLVIRAGRFGIGVFAVFLLGPSFRLRTRHVSADKSKGYTIEATATSQIIEIKRRIGLPIGTTIEVELSNETVWALKLDQDRAGQDNYLRYYGTSDKIDWFCLDWPNIVKIIRRGHKIEILKQKYAAHIRKSKIASGWSVIHPQGFDAVYWTFGEFPILSCNGLKVCHPEIGFEDENFFWPRETQLRSPCIAVFDGAANLPLTTQRYALSHRILPFIDDLARDVIQSFIAHALICGPMSCAEAFSLPFEYPLQFNTYSLYGERTDSTKQPFSDGCLRWCMTAQGMIPADPWLFAQLNAESCLVYGTLYFVESEFRVHSFAKQDLSDKIAMNNPAFLQWNGIIKYKDSNNWDDHLRMAELILTSLVQGGVTALGHEVEASQLLALINPKYSFGNRTQRRRVKKSGEFEFWTKTDFLASQKNCFEARTGSFSSNISLKAVLETIEASLMDHKVEAQFLIHETIPYIIFATEIKTKPGNHSPESLIAKIWNECLGAKAIPFDLDARQSLIAEGCKHPGLKRHIEAWQEMKRTDSIWLSGG